jgi:hypothetical protein
MQENTRRNALIEMGFNEEQVLRVMMHGLNDAIEMLLSHSEPPGEISKECLICSEELSDAAVIVPDCHHAFCKSCISTFVELKITEGQVLRFNCPHHGCTNELTNEQVEADLSEELAQKLALFKRHEQLSLNQNLRWCPRPDCQGYDIGSLNKTSLKCNSCSYEYCYYCAEVPHGKKKCKAEADKLLDKWSRKNGVKYCPNCKRRVMKSAGCNHMTCPRCQYQWCWLCGERFHSFHFEECRAILARVNNPPWYWVVGLMLAPMLLPFALTIMIFSSLHRNFPQDSSNCFRSFIRKKWLSFPLIFLSSLVLSPPIVAIALSFSGPMFLFEIRDSILRRNSSHKCCRSMCLWAPIFMIFGFALSPVLMCVILVVLVVAQFFGVGLLLFKAMMWVSSSCRKSDLSVYANY